MAAARACAPSPCQPGGAGMAVNAGARVIAMPHSSDRFAMLEKLGAERCEIERPDLSNHIVEAKKIDAVLDLVGNSVVLDSLAMLRRGGRSCLAGWLGGLDPIPGFSPLLQMASGVYPSSSAVLFSARRTSPSPTCPHGRLPPMLRPTGSTSSPPAFSAAMKSAAPIASRKPMRRAARWSLSIAEAFPRSVISREKGTFHGAIGGDRCGRESLCRWRLCLWSCWEQSCTGAAAILSWSARCHVGHSRRPARFPGGQPRLSSS